MHYNCRINEFIKIDIGISTYTSYGYMQTYEDISRSVLASIRDPGIHVPLAAKRDPCVPNLIHAAFYSGQFWQQKLIRALAIHAFIL